MDFYIRLYVFNLINIHCIFSSLFVSISVSFLDRNYYFLMTSVYKNMHLKCLATCQINLKVFHITNQWRIQDFPNGGVLFCHKWGGAHPVFR